MASDGEAATIQKPDEAPYAGPGGGATRFRAFGAALPGMLLASALLLPFVDKGFTVDDTVFMREAQHVLLDPLHPTAFGYVWTDRSERVSRIVPTGPVMAWLLAPAAYLDGSERVAHLTVLVFLWMGIAATVSIALRMGLRGRDAAVAGLLLGTTPAVLALSGTAMPDTAAMALGAAGLERFLAWEGNGRIRDALAAVLLLALAALTRVHAALLPLVGAGLALPGLRARPGLAGRLRTLSPLLGVPLLWAAAGSLTRDPLGDGGGLTALGALTSADPSRLLSNLVAFPIHWSAAMTFALPWLVLSGKRVVRSRVAVGAGLLFGALTAGVMIATDREVTSAPLLAMLGAAAICDAAVEAARRRDALGVALIAWMAIPLAALPYVHFPAKYLLIAAPAAVVLVARALASAPPRVMNTSVAVGVVLGALLGVAILRADSALAEVGRITAREVVAPAVAAGRRVWFVGHWGFQWYVEDAGARAMTIEPPYPMAGDLLVMSARSTTDDGVTAMLREGFRGTRVASFTHSPGGGRIMSRALGAGFYSNEVGLLPWTWRSDESVDTVEVFRVE